MDGAARCHPGGSEGKESEDRAWRGGGREIPGPFAAAFQPRIPEEVPVPAPSVPARPSPPPPGDSRPFQLPRAR